MDEAHGDTHTSTAQPIPPRRWWLKRLVGVGLVLLIGVAFLRWQAGVVVQRRLHARIQAIHARGEPVLLEDFREPVLADEDNAAAFLRRAGDPLERDGKDEQKTKDLEALPTALPLSPADQQLMRRLLARYGDSLEQVRLARGKKDANWGIKMQSPTIAVLLTWVEGQRNLANFLRSAALYAHQTGDDAAAVEYLRDMLTVSRANNRPPFLICDLFSISIADRAAAAINSIGPKLRIEQASPSVKPARRQQVQALIAELLDERTMRDGLVRGMQGERLFQLDTVLCIAGGNLTLRSTLRSLNESRPPGGAGDFIARGAGGLLRPILLNDASQMMHRSTQVVEACREADSPAAAAKLPSMPNAANPAARYRAPLTSALLPATGPAIARHHTGVSRLRSAAIVLAERQYQLDHDRSPQRLEDLVPKYLPYIPKNPLAAGNVPMPFIPATQPAQQR